jgi:hypothetical protein
MTLHSVTLLKEIIMALLKDDEPIKLKLLAVIEEIELDLRTED